MKILFFTKYSRRGASSRYRVYQYLDYLKQQGIEADVYPLLNDEYIESMYTHRSTLMLYLLEAFFKRLFYILRARSYDLVVIQKELFPYMPPIFEYLLYLINKNIVLDFDDAIFVKYQNNILLRNKLPIAIRLSKVINVGNRYLADYARKFNPNVNIIPTTINLNKYKSKTNYEIIGNRVVIGWIGTPVTSRFLLVVQEVLLHLSKKYPIVLRCIGTSSDFTMDGVDVENIEWNESTEAENLRAFDIGIMPLTDDPFSRGKCGLKLIQYMAMGIPSIASPVGVNSDIIQDGVNGFLASSRDEWIRKIILLIEDIHTREQIGKEGRQTVINKYPLQKVAPKLVEIYKEAAGIK